MPWHPANDFRDLEKIEGKGIRECNNLIKKDPEVYFVCEPVESWIFSDCGRLCYFWVAYRFYINSSSASDVGIANTRGVSPAHGSINRSISDLLAAADTKNYVMEIVRSSMKI